MWNSSADVLSSTSAKLVSGVVMTFISRGHVSFCTGGAETKVIPTGITDESINHTQTSSTFQLQLSNGPVLLFKLHVTV